MTYWNDLDEDGRFVCRCCGQTVNSLREKFCPECVSKIRKVHALALQMMEERYIDNIYDQQSPLRIQSALGGWF